MTQDEFNEAISALVEKGLITVVYNDNQEPCFIPTALGVLAVQE